MTLAKDDRGFPVVDSSGCYGAPCRSAVGAESTVYCPGCVWAVHLQGWADKEALDALVRGGELTALRARIAELEAEVERLSGLLEEVRPTIKADFGVEEADWLRRVDNALAKPEGGDDDRA